ncbi:hypothetical protein CKY02_18640 [Photorhabdus bodei]|uniref:Uncharacterized protein n=1 Tax=Photorhabdus bodei TaxID=2029681 RepID=A0A329WVJ7_9GAMM|nr:hypothetical protein CKY02_18640 [Photorhabdus bodei]
MITSLQQTDHDLLFLAVVHQHLEMLKVQLSLSSKLKKCSKLSGLAGCFDRIILPLSSRRIYIPVIFQVASLLAALTHPGHIVIYAPGDSLPCRRDAS